MTTKAQIIRDAYTAGGLASYVFDLTSEEITAAQRAMDAMLAQWSVRGLRIAYNAPGGLDEESGVPDWAVEAVVSNLALKVGAMVGKQPMPSMLATAATSYNTVAAVSMSVPERARVNMAVPAGAGNRSEDAWNIYLPEPVEPITTGGDGPLDLGA